MLHIETIKPETLDLLKRLMSDDFLKSYNLVGGTSLALQMGHRISIDLDLFSTTALQTDELEKYLKENYDGFEKLRENNFTLISEIKGVKVDFINYPYPLLDELVVDQGIRMYGFKDISAMKLSAISNTGTRLKDYVDVACLSSYMSLYDMLDNFEKKFESNTSHTY